MIWVYSIDPTTGVPTLVPTSPFADQSHVLSVSTDPKGNFVYAPNQSTFSNDVFQINHTTGELKHVAAVRGLHGTWSNAFSTGTAAVKYVPKFAYVANAGAKSISEYSINADGTLSQLIGSPITDSNGPTAVTATPAGGFVYTVDANHKISAYGVGSTGALTKVTGSPFSGFTNPTAVVTDPSNTFAFVVDGGTVPNPGTIWMEKIGSNGALTLANTTQNASNTPVAAAMGIGSPYLFVVNGTEKTVAVYQVSYQSSISISSMIAHGSTGNAPTAVTVDPSQNFVYVTNSGDGTVSEFKISDGSDGHNQGTPVPIGTIAAGTAPSAVVAEPSGKYLYVANQGSGNISAYKINAKTGKLTVITGSFPTGSAPDSLAVSNDGKHLYASNKSSGSVSVFTINSTGTLTAGTAAATGTSPSSIAATGTRQ